MGKEKKKRKGRSRRRKPRKFPKDIAFALTRQDINFLSGVAIGYGIKKLLDDFKLGLCKPDKPHLRLVKSDEE